MEKQATILFALGGNAILQPGQRGTPEEQRANVRAACKHIATVVRQGYCVVLTHGNGPQVGNLLIQNEETRASVPPMPLDVCGAQTQGMIGYWFQQELASELGSFRPIATILTQVVVDPLDPAFQHPSKPVGPFYSAEKAALLMEQAGWQMVEDAGRGWRRVVPCPEPQRIVELQQIKTLVNSGAVVIAAGGGGIPVATSNGRYYGVEAVIDKDLASQVLASELGADLFVILTDVPGVYLNYGTPRQQAIAQLTAKEAEVYLAEGHFRAGSMKAKVEAAVRFVKSGSGEAVITRLDAAIDAVEGRAGTRFIA
ncbi:MAG: carbamate kinase [Herpetosiphonaceae bacterium]|nr:MAG: carbamate kinase [Herpetosiphonaceae bacterium]